jgi:hypothetical protein
MAVLQDVDRFDVWAEAMREWSREAQTVGVNKADLRVAVNAIDDWVNINASAFNAAIPQPARAALTAPQKALLLMYVIQKRSAKGN